MSIYECTMVDTKREPTPDVRCTNVEMVDTQREPTLDVRRTNVEKHTMDTKQINSRSNGQSKPNSEVKVGEDTIDNHGLDQSVKMKKLSSQNESSNSSTYSDPNGQDYRLLLPDDITPDFHSMDDHMSITVDGRALIDEHSHTCINIRDTEQVLVIEFSQYSVECLKQDYDGNDNDLISAITMLKEIEDADSNDLISFQRSRDGGDEEEFECGWEKKSNYRRK